MISGNLFNLIRDKVTVSQLNAIYTMVTGVEAYSHPDTMPESESTPLTYEIECNWTQCRLKSEGDPVPADIERCQ